MRSSGILELASDLPGHEFVDPIDRMVGKVGQDVTQLGFGINAIESARPDERVHDSGRRHRRRRRIKNSSDHANMCMTGIMRGRKLCGVAWRPLHLHRAGRQGPFHECVRFPLCQHQGLQSLNVVGEIAGVDWHARGLRTCRTIYNTDSGGQVRSGCFQLIPSSSIDNCACVRWILPLSA